MIEDKLEHDERLRLECLAQAIAARTITASTAEVLSNASAFEHFVRTGEAKL